MTAVSATAVTPTMRRSLRGQPASDLMLRVCGGEYDGRIVRIKSGRCTIGSAADCTLRLRSRFVAPHHCVVLRGSERTIVRRWARGTQLNGAGFDDAELNVGDRLAIGPIEFEVVDETADDSACNEASIASAARAGQDAASVNVEELQQALAEKERACKAVSDERNRVAAAANQLRQTVEELRKKLAQQQADENGPSPKPAEQAAPSSSSAKDADRDALLKQIEQLKRDRNNLAEHIERSEKIFSKAAEIESKVEAIEAELIAARKSRLKAENERDAALAEVQELKTARPLAAAPSAEKRGGAQQSEAAPAIDREETTPQPATASELALAATQLPPSALLSAGSVEDVSVSGTISLPRPPSAPKAASDQEFGASAAAESTADDGALNTHALSELKRQLDALPDGSAIVEDAHRVERTTSLPGKRPVVQDLSPAVPPKPANDAVEAPPKEARPDQPVADEPPAVAKPAAASDVQNDEQSIQDYMARLMARVGGGQGANPTSQGAESPVKKKPLAPASPANERPPEEAAAEQSEAPLSPFDPRAKLAPLNPGRKAPEDPANLRAMRELANSTARSAVDASAVDRQRRTVVSKAVFAALSTATAGMCFYWAIAHSMAAAYLGAGVALIFATIWIAQAVLLGQRLRETTSGSTNGKR